MESDPKNGSSLDDIDEIDSTDDCDLLVDDDPVETIVMPETAPTDNVGDVSVEINVEELVAKVEAEYDEDAHRKKEIRCRLEELAESQDFEDTFAIDFDGD